jgi:ABC-2 type transport system ATP-binding protein
VRRDRRRTGRPPDAHRPRTDTDLSVPGVIRASHSNRHTDLLVRTQAGRTDFHPAWQSHPVGLEELILAYLERPAVAS